MASARFVCPTSVIVVQPFDQKQGAKEWKPQTRLVRIAAAPLTLSPIKASGACSKFWHEYFDKRFSGMRYKQKTPPFPCIFTEDAISADVALEDRSVESHSQMEVKPTNPTREPETQTEAEPRNLEASGKQASEAATYRTSRPRNGNLRPNPSRVFVRNEDLVVGAIFTGIVRSIQPFGAFVDIGAFIDGLVHISQLSNTYINTVQEKVSIGQEVQVRIINVNFESKRIGLSMKDPESKDQKRRPPVQGQLTRAFGQTQNGGAGKTGGTRSQEVKNKTVFQKGQTVDAKVKNLIRRGAFLELPGGEEGFLPVAEVPGAEMTPLEKLLPAGKEVSVRIVKVGSGKIGLSMRPVLDLDSLNKSSNRDVEIRGGNAFEIAFKNNPVIAKYLAELEKQKNRQASIENCSADQIAIAGDELGEERSKLLATSEAELIKEELTVLVSDVSHTEHMKSQSPMNGCLHTPT